MAEVARPAAAVPAAAAEESTVPARATLVLLSLILVRPWPT
jgi:hypothetical protein